MELEEDCGDFHDPMLAETFPKNQTCICCDKGTPISLNAIFQKLQDLSSGFCLYFAYTVQIQKFSGQIF